MADLVRVNTRISREMNEWLDKQSEETGIAKSTQIMIAIEGYRKEKEALRAMNGINTVISKLEELERKIEG